MIHSLAEKIYELINLHVLVTFYCNFFYYINIYYLKVGKVSKRL